MFENTIRDFVDYWWHHVDAATAGFNEAKAQEVLIRLRQLDPVLARIHVLEAATLAEMGVEPSVYGEKHNILILTRMARPKRVEECMPYSIQDRSPAGFELQTQLELFYYIANRLLSALRQSAGGLPGLDKVDFAGARTVRNHLIEHSNRKGGTELISLAIGGPDGPRLRPAHLVPGETSIDQGIRYNARELRDVLERAIAKAVAPA